MANGLRDWFKQNIPNPLDPNVNMYDTTLKFLRLRYKTWPLSLMTNLFRFGIAAFAISYFLPGITGLRDFVIQWGLLHSAVMVLIPVFGLRELGVVTEKGENFKALLLNYEYFDALTSALGKIVDVSAAVWFFYKFGPAIGEKFEITRFTESINITYLGVALLVFSLGEVGANIIQYLMLKEVDDSLNFAEVQSRWEVIKSKSEMFSYIPTLVGMFMFANVLEVSRFAPFQFIVIFSAVILALFAWLNVITIRRIQKVQPKLGNMDPIKRIDLSLVSGESIKAAIWSVFPNFNYGSGFMGVGEMKKAENSMLITSHRVLMIEVPMPGRNMLIGEMSFTSDNELFNRGGIKEKGEEMLKTMSLDEMAKYGVIDLPFDRIQGVGFSRFAVTFNLKDGSKQTFTFMDPSYHTLLETHLSFLNHGAR